MILEKDRGDPNHDGHGHLFEPRNQPGGVVPVFEVSRPVALDRPTTLSELIYFAKKLENTKQYNQLRDNLIEHMGNSRQHTVMNKRDVV